MKRGFGRILGVFMLLLVMGMTVCAADAVDIKKNRVFQVNSDVELHEKPDATSAVVASLPGGTAVIVKEDVQGDWCKVGYQENIGYVQIAFLSVLGSPVVPAQSQEAQSSDEATQDVPPADGEAAQGQDAPSSDGEAAQGQDAQPAGEEGVQSQGTQSSDEATQEADADNGTATAQETQPSEEVVSDQDSVSSIDVNTLNQEFENVREENQQSFQAAENALEQTSSSKIWGIVIGVLVVAIFAVGIVTTLVGNKGKKKEK